MIVKYLWQTIKKKHYVKITAEWHGYFLFGIIPLYIKADKVEFSKSTMY